MSILILPFHCYFYAFKVCHYILYNAQCFMADMNVPLTNINIHTVYIKPVYDLGYIEVVQIKAINAWQIQKDF